MGVPFRIKISRDLLLAEIELVDKSDELVTISLAELESFLKEQKVVFGIDKDKLMEIVANPNAMTYPVTVAVGTPPQQGDDAYLVTTIQKGETKKKEKINFRNVMDIPSVNKDEVIARSVPQTLGVTGRGVTGKLLPAKDGKPLLIRAGKNVVKDGNQFIATIAGQVSITNKMIAVNPVFEVNGDLDLKVGNVNFIGNVVIRGNVPTGYEVVSGGDIRIHGLVEGAQLVAKGNIIITGGITGGNRGRVVAGGNIQAYYLNQANIKAGEDIIILSSSLHSRVEAGGSIQCNNGTIIGGQLFAGRDIHVKELGNHLFTKTELTAGYDPSYDAKKLKLTEESKNLSENVKKLDKIEMLLVDAAKAKGRLTDQEKEMILKQRTTKKQLLIELSDVQDRLHMLEEDRANSKVYCIYIYDKIHPNSSMHFGKYTKVIQSVHSYVKFFVQDGEIGFEAIG